MKKFKNPLSLTTLYRIAHDYKKQDKKICLTHGAFDLFHHSHLHLLKKSSLLCDLLIVGVDSDISIKTYKSKKRPIIDEQSRMEIINELDCINAAFVKNISFEKDYHIQLYKNLSIDFLTIGNKYSANEEILEYEATKAGGQLIKFDTKQNYSTTKIINSIVKRYYPA